MNNSLKVSAKACLKLSVCVCVCAVTSGSLGLNEFTFISVTSAINLEIFCADMQSGSSNEQKTRASLSKRLQISFISEMKRN